MVIGVFDSGIGGLSVLYKLSKKFKRATFVYLGDNVNAPYGNRGIFDLKTLFCKNVHELLKYSPDFIVVACNTLSCNVLFELKKWIGKKMQNEQTEPNEVLGYPKAYRGTPRGEVCL